MAAIDVVQERIVAFEPAFMAARCRPDINFQREIRFAMQAIGANDFLAKIALGNPGSFESAIVNIAAVGGTLNPALQEWYLIPRKMQNGMQAVCLAPSYRGLVRIATNSGAILFAQAKLVYANDQYTSAGVTSEPVHKYDPFADRGEIIGGYCCAKLPTGEILTTEMTIGRIFEIRARSESWKAHVTDNKKSTPWVTDSVEMMLKTIIRAASKTWPRLDAAFAKAVELDNDQDPVDHRQEIDITPAPGPAAEPAKRKMTEDLMLRAKAKVSDGSTTVEKIMSVMDLNEEQKNILLEAQNAYQQRS